MMSNDDYSDLRQKEHNRGRQVFGSGCSRPFTLRGLACCTDVGASRPTHLIGFSHRSGRADTTFYVKLP